MGFEPGAVANKARMREAQELGGCDHCAWRKGERGGEGSNNKRISYRNSKASGVSFILVKTCTDF